MKHAILITAYKYFDHLYDIVSFFDERFVIYIHIDKKSVIDEKALKRINDAAIVKHVSMKYNVNWGGRNHLKAILHLSEMALKDNDVTTFHLITGQDYPVKPLNYFVEHFTAYPNVNYLSCYKLPCPNWTNGGLDRLSYYNFYDIINAKKYRKYIFKLVDLQKKFHFKRKIRSVTPVLHGGETYWSLTREAVSCVVSFTKKNRRFLRRLKHTFCAEEIYFQTVIMNSDLAATVVNNSLRFIDWEGRNGNLPANLDITDIEKIKSSDCLFARKFDFPVSSVLKEQLKGDLLR